MISIEQNYQVTDGDFHRFKSSVFFESFYPWIYLSVFLFFFLFSKSSPVSYFFTISRPSFVLYLFLLSYIFSFPNFSEFLFLLIQFEKQLFFFRSFSLLLFHIFSPYSHKNFCRTPTLSLAQFGRPNFSSPLSKTLISIKISKCLSSFYYHIYIYIYRNRMKGGMEAQPGHIPSRCRLRLSFCF